MKLWLMKPIKKYDLPWNDWGQCVGMVVRAASEHQARRIARNDDSPSRTHALWADAAITSCVELTPEGPAGVIIQDYNSD